MIFFGVAGLAIHGWVLITAMSFGHSFVPSQAYVSDHDMIAKSVAMAVTCLAVLFFCRKFVKDFRAPDTSIKAFLVSVFGVLVMPFFVWIIVRATVLTVYPLWLAALVGEDTQLEFSVGDTAGSSFRCQHKVDLAGMPILTGTLCGISGEFHKTLHRGIGVVLSGRGTTDGLFAVEIHVVH
ncbi:hypothetical protein EJ076_28110 [Mesorhizobium sp. M7D.F.Ca.US.005.01.1.1]|nr:hypothetical protein EJ076_28110 [Mesorhizobium sp. M7D.F.Ca.US.005.01.1.1]